MRAYSMNPYYCILLLLFLFYLQTGAFNSHGHSCNSIDLRALHSFLRNLNSTQAHEWPAATANSTTCCSWPGVHCALLSSSPTSSSSLNSTSVRVIGLDLSGKGLEGLLSRSLADMDKLSFLNLSHNSFRGPIPPELFHLKLLEVLDLNTNQLSGALPPSIGNLSRLSYLDVSNNWFTGSIPDAFHTLHKLEVFSAESNEFVGPLPASLSLCLMLTMLDLWNNSLDGSIDLDFGRLVRLTKLDLGWNRLHGHIPEVLSSCKALKVLDLSRNNLSGRVPKTFSNLRSLSYLNLGLNRLSNISQALQVLQNCLNLTVLVLTRCFQGEEMPITGIRGFQSLRSLGIANCALTGPVPSWLRNCKDLRVLILSWNNLSGQIPSWFGGFDHLFFLHLSKNSLYGKIPVSLTRLKSLSSRVALHEDDVSSLYPPFFNWGSVDQIDETQKYKHYTDFPPQLNLSHNKLNGPIWKECGNLKYLHVLDLSWNNLSGPIPEELSSMINLERLDLSFNNLSGSIPSSLTKLSFLSFFSVAYNHLKGLIPTGGQFFSFPCSSFEGNPGLFSNSIHLCNWTLDAAHKEEGDDYEDGIAFMGLPFAIGAIVGFLSTVYLLMCCWSRDYNYYYE